MTPARWAGQPGAVETRNWKLEVQDAPIGKRKSAIYTPARVREDGRNKKIHCKSYNLLKTKGRRTN
jgi:hypothetical protein